MDSAKQIFYLICIGTKDCLGGIFSVRNFGLALKRRSVTSGRQRSADASQLLTKLLYCFVVNGVAFGLAIYGFHYLLLPFMQHVAELIAGKKLADTVWYIVRPILLSLFNLLWIAPLFLVSRILNCIWFQDVADLAFDIASGQRKANLSFSCLAADLVCSVAVQTLFLIQSCVVSLFPIPFVGDLLCLFHLCLLYSLYAFEYKWINMGWPLHKRLAFIDYNWPYFIGFGFPLAIITMMTSSQIASLCLFSIVFPLYIISGTNSTPVVGQFKYRPHVFVPVIYCSNILTGVFIRNRAIRQH